MKLLRLALVGALVLGVTAVRAEDKKEGGVDKKKLMGTWVVTKGETLPVGATVEFTKDGKLKLVIKEKDKALTVEGAYEVKGDGFKLTMKDGDKEHTETLKVKKLTDKELVVEDEKGKKDTFKKK
jgi:uncharacterized protein (TIGR03066 family)